MFLCELKLSKMLPVLLATVLVAADAMDEYLPRLERQHTFELLLPPATEHVDTDRRVDQNSRRLSRNSVKKRPGPEKASRKPGPEKVKDSFIKDNGSDHLVTQLLH